VKQSDHCPYKNVDVAFKDESDRCGFNVVTLKPRHDAIAIAVNLLVLELIGDPPARKQEDEVPNHEQHHWSVSYDEVGSFEGGFLKLWADGRRV
jgi:hypothetical protein